MVQLVRNFVKTSLAAPITAADTSLQLPAGAGAFFDIPAGDWCYLTINTNTQAEVVKYTSTGSVVGDVIIVERAQDGTVAQDFPAAACITEGWNVAQIQGLIDQSIADTPTPTNTMIVTVAPTTEPPAGIFYALMGPGTNPTLYTPGLLWYWDDPSWILVTNNGVQITTFNPPTAEPPTGIIWAINLTVAALWYWTGATWQQIVGNTSTGIVEIASEQGTILPAGYDLPVGTYSFSQLAQAPYNFPLLPLQISYKSSTSASNIIQVLSTGPNPYKMQFYNPCYVQFQASVNGFATDDTKPLNVQLILSTTAGVQQAVGIDLYKPANASNAEAYLSLSTVPMYVLPGAVWDANLVVNGGTPTTSQFTVTQIRLAACVLVLDP